MAVAAALFSTSGSATFLGADLGAATIFFLGLAAGWPCCGATRSPSSAPAARGGSGARTGELREQNARAARRDPQGEDPAPL